MDDLRHNPVLRGPLPLLLLHGLDLRRRRPPRLHLRRRSIRLSSCRDPRHHQNPHLHQQP